MCMPFLAGTVVALKVFRPKRYVITMFADEAGLGKLRENPFKDAVHITPGFGRYPPCPAERLRTLGA